MKLPERPAYEKLGLAPNATRRQIRKRYKELVREFTPEHHPEKFEEINSVYQEITGKTDIDFDTYPIYSAPLQMLKEKIESAKNNTIDTEDLRPLAVIPDSIFTVEFQLEKIMK